MIVDAVEEKRVKSKSVVYKPLGGDRPAPRTGAEDVSPEFGIDPLVLHGRAVVVGVVRGVVVVPARINKQ